MQALIQQAVQQVLEAQAPAPSHGQPSANGQAHGTPPSAPPSKGTTANGAAPFCQAHQVPLELRSNERGSWWSHWVTSEKRYCKGDA